MKAKPRKEISIKISYRDSRELIRVFDQIRKDIRNGNNNLSGHKTGNPYKYEIFNSEGHLPIFDIKIINGVECMVFQSKMNYSDKL